MSLCDMPLCDLPLSHTPVWLQSLFRSLRASNCPVDCSTARVEYVCGTDGVTYASRCELQRAKQCEGKRALGSRVKVRSKGGCPGGRFPTLLPLRSLTTD